MINSYLIKGYKHTQILLLLSFFLFSCECVTDIDTPKQFQPLESVSVNIVNTNFTFRNLEIFSFETKLGEVNFESLENNYISLPIGSNRVKLYDKNSGLLVYSGVVSLVENNSYTLIVHGNEFSPEISILKHKELNNKSNIYLFNSVYNSEDKLKVVINQNDTLMHKQDIDVANGNVSIIIMESDDVLNFHQFQAINNKNYFIILKDEKKHSFNPKIQIIESK